MCQTPLYASKTAPTRVSFCSCNRAEYNRKAIAQVNHVSSTTSPQPRHFSAGLLRLLQSWSAALGKRSISSSIATGTAGMSPARWLRRKSDPAHSAVSPVGLRENQQPRKVTAAQNRHMMSTSALCARFWLRPLKLLELLRLRSSANSCGSHQKLVGNRRALVDC